MASSQDQDVTLTAQCLCKAHSFTTVVKASSLPLKACCCHCTSCRHVTGALFSLDVRWPGDCQELDISALSSYAFSKKYRILFCGTCSSTFFFQNLTRPPSESLGVFTGVLPNLPNLISIQEHIFVGDTIDGGASCWLLNPNSDGAIPGRWETTDEDGEQLPPDWPPINTLPKADAKPGPDEIPIRCHCKGVDLVVRRGDADFAGKPRSELPWFVDPVTHKYHASFDACDSCRLSFGIDLINWTFAQLKHIGFAAGSAGNTPFPQTGDELREAVLAKKDSRFGTLAVHRSSPDVSRYFCSRCSACIFYHVDDRSDMVDIAMGVLESPDGARAESFTSWALGSKVSYSEDAKGGWREKLAASAQEESEAWRIKRDYPKNWRRILKEEAEAKEKAGN